MLNFFFVLFFKKKRDFSLASFLKVTELFYLTVVMVDNSLAFFCLDSASEQDTVVLDYFSIRS